MEELIKYETALLAKEKGFDAESNHLYKCVIKDGNKDIELTSKMSGNPYTNFLYKNDDSVCISVIQSELHKWFRDKNNMSIEVHVGDNEWEFEIFSIKGFDIEYSSGVMFDSYEEALENGLLKAFEFIK